jgi:hypothetical protein
VLRLPHPLNGESVNLAAPLPAELEKFLGKLEKTDETL